MCGDVAMGLAMGVVGVVGRGAALGVVGAGCWSEGGDGGASLL